MKLNQDVTDGHILAGKSQLMQWSRENNEINNITAKQEKSHGKERQKHIDWHCCHTFCANVVLVIKFAIYRQHEKCYYWQFYEVWEQHQYYCQMPFLNLIII